VHPRLHDVAAPLRSAPQTLSPASVPERTRTDSLLSRSGRSLPPSLRLFACGLLSLTFASALFNAICHFVLHFGFPYDSPFVAPISLFCDLIEYVPNSHLLHTIAYFQVPDLLTYPAPCHIIYWLLSLAGTHAVLAYLLSAAIIAGTVLLLFTQRLHKVDISWPSCTAFATILLLTSFPLAFTLYTANIELYLWLLTLCGLWAYTSDREGLAVVCFALAGSAKPYPLLFFLLYLRRGYLHRILQGVAVYLASTLISLWMVYPNIALSFRQITSRTTTFATANILGYKSWLVGYDHTPWSLFKAATSPWTEMHSKTELDIYLAVGLFVTLLLWFSRIRSMPSLEQITFLSVAMLILPPISNDYTLLHLYAPFALLALAIARGQIDRRFYAPALVCYAVLFTPHSYVVAVSAHFAGQLKCLFLVALFIHVARSGRPAQIAAGHAIVDDSSLRPKLAAL
jgi:hypothetical protein